MINESNFIKKNVEILFKNYQIGFQPIVPGLEIAYSILIKASGKKISDSIYVIKEIKTNSMIIEDFYPNLNKQPNSKYLSAAAFYAIAKHASMMLNVQQCANINVPTSFETFSKFFSKLNDFHFTWTLSLMGKISKQIGTGMLIKGFLPDLSSLQIADIKYSSDIYPIKKRKV